LVELALIAPVFLLLLLTAIDLGRLLYSQVTITNAAKEAALVASQGGTYQNNQPCGPTNTVMCGALTEAQGGFVEVDKARVSLTPATCVPNAMYPPGGPPTVTVSVSAPFRVVTPIIGQIVGSNLVLSATADAECLVVPQVTFPSLPNPTAAFTATPTSGSAPLDVTFNATGSFSPGATITAYSWSFGGSSPTITHTFAAGTHIVTLTVTDSRGQTDTDSTTITVSGGGGGTPTPTPPPSCPTIDFSAVNKSNGGHPHRMDLAATLTPPSSGWTFTWIGSWSQTPPVTGQGVTVDFLSSGSQSVSVTAVKGSCTVTKTKAVTAP
jgi:PKD repeat protein